MGGVSIGTLIGTIALDDKFSKPAGDVAKSLGFASDSFRAVTGFAGLAAAGITAAAGAVVMLGQRGAAVADVRDAFSNLSAAAGSSADVMLGALQRDTLGTISSFDLMQMSNATLSTGLVRSADDMETLAAGAKLLADRTGGDTADAFQTLTSAIASGRTTSLKQLGLFVDSKSAIEAYAKSLNKSVGDLSDSERAQALSAAAIAALKGQLEAAGPATADFGDQIDRGKVAVQNFTDNLAVAVATSPVVAAGMDAIQKGVMAAFGGNQADLVKTLMGFVNDFAIGLTYVAQVAVTGAGVFVTAWFAVKTVILGVIAAVSASALAIVTLVDGIVDLAMKVPGGAAVVGDLAGATEELRLKMEGTTQSLVDQTTEAARGVVGNSDLHRSLDALGGGILLARDAMVAAKDATAGMTETTAAAVKPIADIGVAATLTAAQIKAIEDQTNASMAAVAESMTVAANLQMSLQNQIAVLQTTGTQQRLLELDIARQAEIAGIQNLAFEEQEVYAARVAQITEKYGLMVGIATGANLTIAQRAADAGIRMQAALQETADKARELWADMVASGTSTADEIRQAWERAEEAKRAATRDTAIFTVGSTGEMLTATASALAAFGVRFKALALAGAIISGISAVQKALAAPPGFPLNAVSVGIATAMAAVNVARIASSPPGYRLGTGPGGQFRDFGRVTTVDVHGPEAIVTPKQGASIAGMVEDALTAQDTRMVDELRELREDLSLDRRRLPILLRDAALKMIA